MPTPIDVMDYNPQLALKNPQLMRGITRDMEVGIKVGIEDFALTTKVFQAQTIPVGTVFSFPRNSDDESYTSFKDTVARPARNAVIKAIPAENKSIYPPEMSIYGTFPLNLANPAAAETAAKALAVEENLLLFDLLRSTTNLSTSPMTDDIYNVLISKANSDTGMLIVPNHHANTLPKIKGFDLVKDDCYGVLHIKGKPWTVYIDKTETLQTEIFAITGVCGVRAMRRLPEIIFNQDPNKLPTFFVDYFLSLTLQDARKVARMVIV